MFKKISLILLLPLVGTVLATSGSAMAANNKNGSSVTAVKSGDHQGIGYTVKPDLPQNQRNGILGYYDVRIKAGATQTLSGTIYNLNTAAIKVQPQLNLATTNSTGTIEYGRSKNPMDASLINRIPDVAKFNEKIITVPGDSKRSYHLTVKMPKKQFAGVMAGGIRFYNLSQDQQKQRQNLQFKNEYAYVIGLVLQNSNQAVAPRLSLGSVLTKTINGGNTIVSSLHNSAASFYNGFDIQARVTKQGSSKTVYSATSQNLEMAPNSILAYPLSLKGTPLKSGEYTMRITISAKYGDPLHFLQNFKITAADATAKNRSDVYIAAAAKANADAAAKQRQLIIISVLGTVGVLALIAGTWWLIKRKH